MESYYSVTVTYDGDKKTKVDFLVKANSEKEAICKTVEYFSNHCVKVDIGNAKLTSICCFLGNRNASWFYKAKISFICNGLEVCKTRTFAVGTDEIIDAIKIVEQAMADIQHYKARSIV